MRISIAVIITGIFLSLTACKKQDHCQKPPKKDSTCDLMQSALINDSLSGDEPGLFSEYRKEYDNSGKVRKVVAGVYSLRLDDSVALLLTYKGSTIYMVDEKKPTDTFLIVTFDSHNRLQEMRSGNATISYFETTSFSYESGHLSGYLIRELFQYHVAYDGNGNVAHIYSNYDEVSEGLFFTYDYTVHAKRQWYTDHFPLNGVSNSVYLAQFLGWLPDLEPVNKRVYWKEIYNDVVDDSTSSVITERALTNHMYDSNGNLVSYRSGDAVYTRTWSCEAKATIASN